MTVDVTVNGRGWKIALEPADTARTFAVTIKGTTRYIEASWIEQDTLSLLDNGTVREIRLHRREENGEVAVEFQGRLYEAAVAMGAAATGAVRRQATAQSAQTDATGTINLKAPMPGRVVRVLVAVGDRVTARQAVVVVEAMKMENELRTPRDGVVKDVMAVAGTAVESGAILIVVDQK